MRILAYACMVIGLFFGRGLLLHENSVEIRGGLGETVLISPDDGGASLAFGQRGGEMIADAPQGLVLSVPAHRKISISGAPIGLDFDGDGISELVLVGVRNGRICLEIEGKRYHLDPVADD